MSKRHPQNDEPTADGEYQDQPEKTAVEPTPAFKPGMLLTEKQIDDASTPTPNSDADTIYFDANALGTVLAGAVAAVIAHKRPGGPADADAAGRIAAHAAHAAFDELRRLSETDAAQP